MARLAWSASELRSATGFCEGRHGTAEALTRPRSGVLAGRCVLYPPHSEPLLLSDGIVFTELVNSRIAGSTEIKVSVDGKRKISARRLHANEMLSRFSTRKTLANYR